MAYRVLLTGGAGFIGSYMARRLLARGHQIVVLDDFSTGTYENVPRSVRLAVVRGSVTEPADVRSASRGVDLVVHLAGVVGMRLAHADRERAYSVAVDGTRHVLKAARTSPVVLFSSSAVYGLQAGRASESSEPSVDVALRIDGGAPGYASGKLELEMLGAAAARAGQSVLIIRPFNVVGPRQTSAYGMVVPTFVGRALRGDPLCVHDDGQQTRSFSDVDTFIDCVTTLIWRPDTWAGGRNVFNVGIPNATSIDALARLVIEQTRSSSLIEHVPYGTVFPGKQDVRSRDPDVTRLSSVIGAVSWPSIEHIIRRCVAAVQSAKGVTTGRPNITWNRVHDEATARGRAARVPANAL